MPDTEMHTNAGVIDQVLTIALVDRYPDELFVMDGDTDQISACGREWSAFGYAAADAGYRVAGADTAQFVGIEAELFTGVKDDHLAHRLQLIGTAYQRSGTALSEFAIALSRLQSQMEPVAADAPHTYELLQEAVAAVRSAGVLTAPSAMDQLVRIRARWESLVTTATDLQRELGQVVERTVAEIKIATGLRFTENPLGEQIPAVIGGGLGAITGRPADPVAANTGAIATAAAASDGLAALTAQTPAVIVPILPLIAIPPLIPVMVIVAYPLVGAAVASAAAAAAVKTSTGVGDWQRVLARLARAHASTAAWSFRVVGDSGASVIDSAFDASAEVARELFDQGTTLTAPSPTPGGGTAQRDAFFASLNPTTVADPDARVSASRFGTGELTSLDAGLAPPAAPFVFRIPTRFSPRRKDETVGADTGRHDVTGTPGERIRVVVDPGTGYEQLTVPRANGTEQTFVLINNQDAPVRDQFAHPVPAGGRLARNPDGSVSILGPDERAIGHIQRPWAYDAVGREVETEYTVDGTTLIQTIAPTADTIYPILADPESSAITTSDTPADADLDSAVSIAAEPPAPTTPPDADAQLAGFNDGQGTKPSGIDPGIVSPGSKGPGDNMPEVDTDPEGWRTVPNTPNDDGNSTAEQRLERDPSDNHSSPEGGSPGTGGDSSGERGAGPSGPGEHGKPGPQSNGADKGPTGT
ncbi:hypothetical protein ACFWPJ_20545, partial [Nocardia sp. NPDC058497]